MADARRRLPSLCAGGQDAAVRRGRQQAGAVCAEAHRPAGALVRAHRALLGGAGALHRIGAHDAVDQARCQQAGSGRAEGHILHSAVGGLARSSACRSGRPVDAPWAALAARCGPACQPDLWTGSQCCASRRRPVCTVCAACCCAAGLEEPVKSRPAVHGSPRRGLSAAGAGAAVIAWGGSLSRPFAPPGFGRSGGAPPGAKQQRRLGVRSERSQQHCGPLQLVCRQLRAALTAPLVVPEATWIAAGAPARCI